MSAGAQIGATAKVTLPLHSNWEFRQVREGAEWKPAQVPGVVHTDLLRNGMIPDPFYRDNEEKLQWIENEDWEYRSTFQVSAELLGHKHIELVFDGLDTVADVTLNGKQVLQANNMFRTWRVDAKPLLKPGANQLVVLFRSTIKENAKLAAADPWHAAFQTSEDSYTRKAAYEYGWDWGPRFVTSGIWRPVKLEAWDAAKVSDLNVRQRDVTAAIANLSAEVEVTSTTAQAAAVSVRYQEGNKAPAEVSRVVQLHAGLNHVDFPLNVVKPALWYPVGYGAQPMYRFQATVKVAGRLQDTATVKAGLRSVVLRRERDQWGRSFEFVVNGIPIFAKGADVIPFDSFPTRVTTADYRKVLESARDANLNMIRHWGGGYYETDEFYEICDELGLMVWQDFMFGNKWQPGLYEFKLNVALEAEDQLRRLRNHPSIVLWCGNNETESAWRSWIGDKVKPRLNSIQRDRYDSDYVSLFSGVLQEVARRLAPETPYWPSSPSADYEDVTPGVYDSGDDHRWDVWHGNAPLTDYEKSTARFTTEYGFQSFPEMNTVASFTTAEDRTGITTPVMLAHQKNAAGNEKIHTYLLREYPEPKDFASFLYVSQILQAQAMKIGAEHFRRIRPRSMGSIYWQLNDCWPVASWASLDSFGRWKALQYYTRRFYAPLLVTPHEENGKVAVYIVSDEMAVLQGELHVRLLGLDGKVLSDKSQAVAVLPLASKVYSTLEVDPAVRSTAYVETVLMVGGSPVSSNLLFFVPAKQMQMPKPKITSELTLLSDHVYKVRLSSDTLARDVRVDFGTIDAWYSDNYFNLVPGRTVEITVTAKAALEELQKSMKVTSLTDAFLPQPTDTISASPARSK